MKMITICSTASVSANDPTLFVNYVLLGIFWWAYPSCFQTCKAISMDIYNSYASLWMSFYTFGWSQYLVSIPIDLSNVKNYWISDTRVSSIEWSSPPHFSHWFISLTNYGEIWLCLHQIFCHSASFRYAIFYSRKQALT